MKRTIAQRVCRSLLENPTGVSKIATLGQELATIVKVGTSMSHKLLYQYLKELHEHLLAKQDSRGLLLLKKTMDMLRENSLADVSEGELMDFLHSIEQMENEVSEGDWVSTSAVRTHVGMVTRGMIEKEISRRSSDLDPAHPS